MQYTRTDFDIHFTLEMEIKYCVMRSKDKESAVQESLKKLSVLHTFLPPCFQPYFWRSSLHSSPSQMSVMCCHCLAAGFTWTTTDKQHHLQIYKLSWEVKGMLPISPVTNTLINSVKGTMLFTRYQVSQHISICYT